MFKQVKSALRFMKPKKQKPKNQQDQEQNSKKTVTQYDEMLKTQFNDESTVDTSKNKEYEDYVVQQQDSLIGIALKFDMSVELLKRINHLSSEFICQGMVLKVFKLNLEDSAEEDQDEEGEENEQIEQDIWKQQTQQYTNIPMYYCMDDQNVKGLITVREDMILFDTNQIQQQPGKRIINNACISINDINEAKVHILPNANDQKDYLIQILLSGIGRVKLIIDLFQLQNLRRYSERNQKNVKNKKRVQPQYFLDIKRDMNQVHQFQRKQRRRFVRRLVILLIILSKIYSIKRMLLIQLNFLIQIQLMKVTTINKILIILIQELDNVIGKRMGRLWASISYVPKYKANSNCLNESLYKQLIELIPAIYRLSNWNIKFTIDKDGSSYEQLLLSLEHQNPFFFTIKDKDGNVFGAYVSSELKNKKPGFHGTGETFLFQQEDEWMIPYYWKETNNDFVNCDSDGFCVGCGPSFGIFVDSKLYFGYNNSCTTFENPRFTQNEKYLIQHLEVWAIEQL